MLCLTLLSRFELLDDLFNGQQDGHGGLVRALELVSDKLDANIVDRWMYFNAR